MLVILLYVSTYQMHVISDAVIILIVEHFLKVHKEYTFTEGKQKFDKIKELF